MKIGDNVKTSQGCGKIAAVEVYRGETRYGVLLDNSRGNIEYFYKEELKNI
jgi:hypothetical protein